MTSRFLPSWATVCLISLAVAGCQSEGSEWKKHFNDSALKPPSSAVEERFGRGPVEITLLLPRGSTGVYDETTRDVRDGAALAATELGDAYVTVRVVDTSGGPEAAKLAAEAAAGRQSALLLSYSSPEATSAIASIPAAERPPIINLASAVAGQSVFNFRFDDVEAAGKAVAAAGGAERKAVVVFIPSDFSPEQEKRLTAVIQEAGGRAEALIRYGTVGDEAGKAVEKQAELVKKASAVLVLGSTPTVNDVLTNVRKLSATQILGTEGWPRSAISNPSATGALIAASDQEGAALIADRYLRHKGRALTPNAVRAYDSIAIGSGLVRAGGAEAINASTLSAPTGFRGVGGVFRFNANGTTERQFGVYKIQSGKLAPLQEASASF
nr:ABC transporter substrate-binding protein [Rhizobium sp. Khangiran2]